MFSSGSSGHYNNNNNIDESDSKQLKLQYDQQKQQLMDDRSNEEQQHQQLLSTSQHEQIRHIPQPTYSLTHHQQQPQQLFQPSNNTSSLPLYHSSVYTISHHNPHPDPHVVHQQYSPYDYNIRLMLPIEQQFHSSLDFISHPQDQTLEQDRGRDDRDNYDPTVTPVPSPSTLPQHSTIHRDDQVMMLLSASSLGGNLMQQSTPSSWETENLLPSHRLNSTAAAAVTTVEATTTSPVPAPSLQSSQQQQQQELQPQERQSIIPAEMHTILHESSYDRHRQEQELFGRLVSMAQTDNIQPRPQQQSGCHSGIWEQQQTGRPPSPQQTQWLTQQIAGSKGSNTLIPPMTTFRTSASRSTASSNTTPAQEIETILFPSTRHQQTESMISSSTWQRKDEREYSLEIVQQPSRARMCGFGDKDRRPISPPPILQLLVRNNQGAVLLPQEIDTSFFVVLCDCYDETGANPANIILHSVTLSTSSAPLSSSSSSYQRQQQKHHEQQQQQQASSSTASLSSSTTSSSGVTNKTIVKMKNLVGSCIASPSKLYNEQHELGIYFVFHDLSLRSEGRFRLIFSLIDIGSSDYKTLNTESISHVLTAAKSDIFTSFTAKHFPGVVAPTQLSQCFARQGVKIPTRRDTKSKRMRKKSSETKEVGHQQRRQPSNE